MSKYILLISMALCFAMTSNSYSAVNTPQTNLSVFEKSLENCVGTLLNIDKTNLCSDVFKTYWYKRDEADGLAQNMIGQIASASRMVEQSYGKYDTYEYLGKSRLGSSMVKYAYLLKYEHIVTPLIFTCYNNGGKWEIIGFTYGDNAWDDMKKFSIFEPPM